MQLFRGHILYSKSREELAVFENSYLAVEDGIIKGVYETLPQALKGLPVQDFGERVIIPAFSDLHVHAPQYPQRALAMDLLLNDWLNSYTFPLEARYADPDFAHAVYDAFVEDLIANGTLHACIFGTIHPEATGYLLEKLEEKGLSAYVGKVNMDKASPEYLCETTEDSLRRTEEFLEKYAHSRTARPILTPRFAPTCSQKLLDGLGILGRKYQTGVQTHIVESRWEAAQALLDFPDASCDMEIYEKAGLLENGPVVMAHFLYPSEEDIRILKKYHGFAVQCPDSTANIIAGIMRNSYLADLGVSLSLGSDIAGGHHIGVYSQVAKSVQLSKLKWLYEPEGNRPIDFPKAFYMATKQGGEIFGRVGSLEKGYRFDALVIDNLSDPFLKLSPRQVVERFCHIGTKDQIAERYLNGKRIPPAGRKN